MLTPDHSSIKALSRAQLWGRRLSLSVEGFGTQLVGFFSSSGTPVAHGEMLWVGLLFYLFFFFFETDYK